MRAHLQRLAVLLLLALTLLGLVACNNLSNRATSTAPRVTITAPPSGQRVPTGKEVEVQSVAVGQTPIERVDMYVNNDLIHSDTSPIEGGQFTFNVVQRWVPTGPGRAEVKVVAYDVNGVPSQPEGIVLEVVGEALAVAEATATIPAIIPGSTVTTTVTPAVPVSEGTPVNVGTPPPNATTVEVFTPTPAPTATVLPSPPASGTEIGGTVAVRGLNVREGPGTSYRRIASLRSFETVTATGRNQETTWARVRFASNRTGWVATQYVTWEGDISTLPVVQP